MLIVALAEPRLDGRTCPLDTVERPLSDSLEPTSERRGDNLCGERQPPDTKQSCDRVDAAKPSCEVSEAEARTVDGGGTTIRMALWQLPHNGSSCSRTP